MLCPSHSQSSPPHKHLNNTDMARTLSVCDTADEDYIDMEVSSSPFFRCSLTSPPHHGEFEFPGSLDRERTTSPADELFYKGKLLPLHLPPRLQMVQNLLTTYDNKENAFDTPSTTAFHTPLESGNVSPSESCQVSRELTAEEYFLDFPKEETCRFIEEENPKKSWQKKLKLIKQSSFGNKLKASRAYLKGLFSKSGCSIDSCTVSAADNAADQGPVTIGKECLNNYTKVGKRNPFGQIQRERYQQSARGTEREKMIDDNVGHRMSFSGAIEWHTETKNSSPFSTSSSSSSSSFSGSNSNGFYELHLLKRSSSANSEIETSVQGAIAHCKQSHSQQTFERRKITSDQAGFSSFSATRIAACEDQERSGVCRG